MKQLSALLNQKIYRCRLFGVAIILTLMAGFTVVNGQTTFGRISGTVTDNNGAVVANANVTATNPATNFSRTATTDDSGFYSIPNLPVGNYNVAIEAANFKKSIKNDNVLNADARLTVDFSMTAGQISEVVEVTQTSGETVNTTSGEVAKVIDGQQVDNMALNGRNYYQLLSVIPGAVVTADDALDTNLRPTQSTSTVTAAFPIT